MRPSDAARVVGFRETHYPGPPHATHYTTTERQMTQLGHAVNTTPRSSVHGLQLLIVDDNRVIRDAVAALLVNQDGVGSVTATNLGPDTLHEVDDIRPDLVLLPSLGARTADLTRATNRTTSRNSSTDASSRT